MRKRFLIPIFFSLMFHNLNLFSQQISFTPVYYISEKSNRAFLGITQDRLGNIWLTSFDGGIYRYDGSGFIDYEHNDTDSNSISSYNAECIYADSTDIIWVGTYGGGLDRFDPSTNRFTHFRHLPSESSSLANDTVMAILKDREGNFWVGTRGGLDLFDSKAGTFKHYPHNPDKGSGLSSNQVRSIYEDHQGTLWIGCGSIFAKNGPEEGGLNRFNRSDGSFTSYIHDPGNPNSLETNKVQALFEDSKGNFWVGTSGNGLHIMDRTKGTFTHYYYDSTHPEKLSRPPVNKFNLDHITFINEDILGGIWIGSFLGGINRYDPAAKKITHYGKVMDGTKSLHILEVDTASGYLDYSSWQALFLPDGQIWFTVINPISGPLFYHAAIFRKGIPFYHTNKMGGANTFYDDSDSLLWVGTDNGLIKKNLVLQTEKIYVNEPRNPNSLSNSFITVIRVDKEKNFWLGTNGGLNKYDPVNNQFIHYRLDPKIESSLSNDTIWSMCLDHNDELWVGTSNGLDKLDKKSGGFTHFKLENRNRVDNGNLVYCIREDQNGQLWVGTEGGLYRVNIGTGTVITVLPSANTRSICVDSKNVVWIGSDTGRINDKQNMYRLNQGQFVLFADSNMRGKITYVFDIVEDNHQNLWVSTRYAIFRINDKRDVVRRFGSEYGVSKNGFDLGDNFKAGNGKLFFGDSRGYYSFFPEDLKGNNQPLLNFTSFRLNGKEVIPGEGGILKKAVWRTDEIRLSHDENNFSFEFEGIDDQGLGEVKYLVMLENYDDDWLDYVNGRRANYFNVPPGNYTLRVKAFSSDGAMSEKSMRIIISPPWWKTWWAYTIFSLVIIGAIRGFIVYRSRKLVAENRLLEEKVTSRTEQLNLSLKELKSTQNQLIQSEKMASLGELTAGIAHEIQNPLNFVNNFSEVNKELVGEMKEELDKGNLAEAKAIAEDIETNEDKIMFHGKRADSIVKGMLQHSRSSNGMKQPTDINALADEYLRLSYHGLRAKDKSFNATLQTDYDNSIGKINIIPQDIGRVLLNLYNNAFFAVEEKAKGQTPGYEPIVSVSSRKIKDRVQIRVRDNGSGIPPKILDKIFQPFFTTKPTGQGTGLGLSLSYDIIKAHGGEMKVESKKGDGAEFVVQIPIA
jgi:signal transduction histidine kinase/ligand-binding sensor domain-containing protein